MFRVEVSIDDVRRHDRVYRARVDQAAVWLELAPRPRLRDIGHAEVRIDRGTAQAREVLEARRHSRLPVGVDLDRGETGHDGWIGGERATQSPDRRILRVDIEVDDRREVEVDADVRERASDPARPGSGHGWIVRATDLGFGGDRR